MNPLLKRFVVAFLPLSMCTLFITGCPSASTQTSVVEALQAALSSLDQNRALSEQYVRDIKETDRPDNPNYQQARDSYEEARDAYNHYVDIIENPEWRDSSRSMRTDRAISNARTSAAQFIADATTALRPDVSTRSIPFQRSIAIPDNLQAALQKLKPKDREQIIDNLDSQVRWRTWAQL